jgi:hypothetical protein
MLKNILKYSIIYFVFNIFLLFFSDNNIYKKLDNSVDIKILETIMFVLILICLINKKYVEGMTQYKKKN